MHFTTDNLPVKMWLVRTEQGNEFFGKKDQALARKHMQDEQYHVRGLSKRATVFLATVTYEVDAND